MGGRLFFAPGPPRDVAWVANIWYAPRRIEITSINEAARALRAIQRNWALYSIDLHRRAALIAERLPTVSAKPLIFGASPPSAPLGSWTLLDERTLLAAPHCRSAFPHGEITFVENHALPPSRAYLKLWELFTLLSDAPKPGELCLDLGAAPGGWSWVLAGQGARVMSVDKAALDPAIAGLPGLFHHRESAFGLDPRRTGPIDWLFADLACYPQRLFTLVQRWREAGTCKRFVCTLKFQGATDHEIIARFRAIPGSRLLHLHHNKHELTWVLLPAL